MLDRIRADFDGLKIFFEDPVLPDNGYEGKIGETIFRRRSIFRTRGTVRKQEIFFSRTFIASMKERLNRQVLKTKIRQVIFSATSQPERRMNQSLILAILSAT